MKKNDIAAIILIVMFATVLSFVAASALIGSPQNNPVQVETVTPIQDSFAPPDSRIFNEKSIDPTVNIKGGSQSSSQPFSN
jgi:hypothetical protein